MLDLLRHIRRFLIVLALLGLMAFSAVGCGESDEALPQGPATMAKLLVPEDGMYQVTAAELKAAGLGWHHVDVNQLRLLHRGHEQPLWVQRTDGEVTLRFYGQASHSRYATNNVYFLQHDGGPAIRMAAHKVEGQTAATDLVKQYVATVRAEENVRYEPRVNEGEHWFWASLPAPRAKTFDVSLSDLAPGAASLTVEVWASTEAPASPDHHLRVAVNGQLVADEEFDGQGRHTITAEVPAGLLQEAANAISIEAPGDTGVAADVVFVDWIAIDYPRFLIAEGDRLAFEGAGRMQLSGFTGPVTLFDVTAPDDVVRVSGIQEEQHEGETRAVFTGESGRQYLAVGPTGYRRPARIARAVTEPDLSVAGSGADYLAIGPPDLLEPLQPLLDRREQQGLRVTSVPIEAVYDQFHHGLPEPDAIRKFLKHAVASWEPAPQYVLLVGDASYDPRGYITPAEANRVPSFLVSTVFGGETASDTAFAQLDDDLKPDVAIGRMPARTPEQVRVLVEKARAYEEQASTGAWRRRILAVADGQDPSFRSDAQAFLDGFSDKYHTELLDPEAGATGAGQEVQHRLDDGNLLVAYFGHGSVTQWGKDRIFTTADVASLGNGERLPVMLNMTCLTGLFTHPKVESLAETLLWEPEGGAVAVLAPTSLTLPTDQSFLSQALVEALLADSDATLGQIFLRAQRQVPTEGAGTRDVMQTFLLFGDPALPLALQ